MCTGKKREIFLIHSFIHSVSTCYVSGPVLSTGDTELDMNGPCPQGMLGLIEEMDEKAAVSVRLVSAMRDVYTGPGEPNRGTGQPQGCDHPIQSSKLQVAPLLISLTLYLLQVFLWLFESHCTKLNLSSG